MPTWNQAAAQARQWDDVVLTCRLRGHAWEQSNSRKEGRLYVVFFDCNRGCGVRKTERWDSRGRIVKAHSVYPKNADGHDMYLSTIGRLDAEARGALRIETLDRRGEK